MCSILNSSLRFFLLYYNRNLEQELSERQSMTYDNNLNFFTEDELWYILAGLAQGLKTLLDAGITHGDIQPATIMVTQNGNVKLMDIIVLGPKGTGYYRMLMNSEYCSPLSPQLLEGLRKRESIPTHFAEKSDIFS